MGNCDDMLEFLVMKRVKLSTYDMFNPEQKVEYLQKIRNDIEDEFKVKAFSECILNKYRAHYNKLIDEGNADECMPLMKVINQEKAKADESKSDFCFITVNPAPGVPLSDFRKAVEKSVKKTFIKKSLYVLEQRGETMEELGKGFHTHILIDKGDFRPSHLRREFARTFSKVCDTSNPHCFNVNYCKIEDLPKRQKYMLGVKSDPKKHQKQRIDRPFRRKFAIKDYEGELFAPWDDDDKNDIAQLVAGF